MISKGRRTSRKYLTRRGSYLGSRKNRAWQTLAQQVKERDNYSCQVCGITQDDLSKGQYLQIHHIKRLSRGGTDSKRNLVTLCHNCHSKQAGHKHIRKAKKGA